jgi:hypothetical protein
MNDTAMYVYTHAKNAATYVPMCIRKMQMRYYF